MNRRAIPTCFERFLPIDTSAILSEIEAYRAYLTIGLCHSDLFPLNAVFQDQRLYVLDLENMGRDYTLLDLGMTAFGMVTSRTTVINEAKVQRLLEGYSTRKDLSRRELCLLPSVVTLAGLKIALWRYQHWPDTWQEALEAANRWYRYVF